MGFVLSQDDNPNLTNIDPNDYAFLRATNDIRFGNIKIMENKRT